MVRLVDDPAAVSAPRQGARARSWGYVVFLVAWIAALLVAMTLAVGLGPVSVSPGTVWRVLVWHVVGVGDPYSWTDVQDSIVWVIRSPRVVLSALVGAGLGVVGVAMQALVRNPLADPYLLGISSGAGLGAVLVIVGGVSFGMVSVSAGAFVGALLTFLLVYAMARRGGTIAPLRLILAGVAVAFVMSGVTTWLVLSAEQDQMRAALFWLQGSLAGTDWADLGLPAAMVVIGVVALGGLARQLNGLVMGDETAASLGIDVKRLRPRLFVLSSLVVAVLVALSGGIGFVGLIVPHAVRLMIGTDHRRVLVASALVGATFLVVVDLLCRTVIAPGELPVGVVTAIVGGPAFLWLMRSMGERGRTT